MATIEILSKDTTSVTLYLDNLDEGWSNGTRTTIWYLGKGYIPSEFDNDKWAPGEDIEDRAPSGGEVTFENLETDTRYYVLCEVWHGANRVKSIDGEFVTDSEEGGWEEPDQPLDIVKWDWSATNERLQAWLSLTVPKLYPIEPNFSHNVWNALVDKVAEVRSASGTYHWDSTHASLNDTKMNSKPYELTAVKFNSLRNNLNLVCDYRGVKRPDMPFVYSMNKRYPVLASYFNEITNAINRCIDGY